MGGTKLEGAFKKMKGKNVGESNFTITILPKSGKASETVYSKRDVAISKNRPNESKAPNPAKFSNEKEQQKIKEQPKEVVNSILKRKTCEQDIGQIVNKHQVPNHE